MQITYNQVALQHSLSNLFPIIFTNLMKMRYHVLPFFGILVLTGCVSCTPLWLRKEKENPGPVIHRSLAEYKLPESVVPLEYDIHLIPYMEETAPPKNFTFDGHVQILLRADEATTLIKLHANDMEIIKDSVKVHHAETGEEVGVVDVTLLTDDRNFLEISLAADLEITNEYTLDINFVGKLNDDMEGFYRSNYYETDGEGITKEKWMLVTQFEQTYARRAFPCFDEPALKAVFRLSVARQLNWIVLSNMPVDKETSVNQTGIENWIWTNFKPSVVMSPYLLAFSVTTFNSITSPTDKRFKVWARPDFLQAGQYANGVAPQVISFMEDFTGHKYPLPKMDEIAVPDFAAGAMENWGLVTYRESALLYDESVRTTSDKQGTASVVAHELAHQWFGNLVSPKWWSNTWLNEGFATFFAAYAASNVETEWQLKEQFLTGDVWTAMNTDGQESAHPLVDETVDSPSAASAIFDSISYSKGGSVIRMVLDFMGEDNFRSGIDAYLEEMQYESADQNDLWRGLAKGVPVGLLPEGVELSTIMDSWALQAGVPLVTVTRNYDTNKASVTQKRFFNLPNENEHNEKYWIPLTKTEQGIPETNDITWLHDQDLTLDMPGNGKWVIFNNRKNGYYRVNYDAENWRLLSAAINASHLVEELDVMNRAQLIFDSFALAKAKELDYATALTTTNYLAFETNFIPWSAALNHLSYINDRFAEDKTARNIFQRYLMSRMHHLYDHVSGFNISQSDSHTLRLLRGNVLSWMCSMGDKTCNEDGFRLFTEWRELNQTEPNPIIPDLKSIAYASGMRMGGQKDYNFLYVKYRTAVLPSEVSLIINAFGASKNPDFLKKLLTDSIAESSPFWSSDARAILSAVQNNPDGTNIALDFIIKNFFEAVKYWGASGSVFTSIAGRLNTAEQRQKLQSFLDSNTEALEAAAVDNLKRALQALDGSIQWHEQHKQQILAYLTEKMGSSATITRLTRLLVVFPILLIKYY